MEGCDKFMTKKAMQDIELTGKRVLIQKLINLRFSIHQNFRAVSVSHPLKHTNLRRDFSLRLLFFSLLSII